MRPQKKSPSLEIEENKSVLVNDALLDIFDFNKIANKGIKCLNAKISDEGLNFVVFLSNGELIHHDFKQNKMVPLSKSIQAATFEFLPNDLIAIAHKNTVEILYLRNGKPAGRLGGHETEIKKLQVSARKEFLMSLSEDVCLIWSLKDFTLKKKIHSRASNFIEGTFNKDGKSLFLAMEDHTILCFSLPNFTQQKKFAFIDHPAISFLICSFDSQYIFAGGNFNYIIVFELNGFSEKSAISLPNGCFGIQKMEVFSQNIISFLGENRVFYLLNYENSHILLSFNLDFNKLIYSYSLSYKNQVSIFLSTTGEIFLYDLQKLLNNAKNIEDKYRSAGLPEAFFTQKVPENPDFFTSKAQSSSTLFSSKPEKHEKHEKHEKQEKQEKFNTLKKTNKSSKNQEKVNKDAKTQPQFYPKNLNFSELTPQKLRKFLDEFKRFPSKNRALIWKILLSLPNNEKSFSKLHKKPIHPGISSLKNNFPIENQSIYNNLQKILSNLGYHCSLFPEIDFFPAMIFPFVKILEDNQILCFEVILSFLMNWGRDFFMDFPNPPIGYLEKIEDLLKFHDFELYVHFTEVNLDIPGSLWPIFKSNYTDILSKEDWLVLIDNTFAHSPQTCFYPLFLISYLSYFRSALLNLHDRRDFSLFFSNQNAVNIEKLMTATHKLIKSTPKDLLEKLSTPYTPLSSHEYPQFTYYPQVTIDYHNKLRDKIASEERELINRKKQVNQLNFLAEDLIEREKRYRKRQENLLRLETERRERLLQEENQRLLEKIDEDRKFRTKRIDQLKVLENTISSSLRNQEKLREEEMVFLQKELDSRKMLEEHLLESKLEEEALLGLEFTMSQKVNEIISLRNREERQRKIRQELDFKAKQENFAMKLTEERWKNEDMAANLQKELQKQQKLVELNELEEKNDDENMRFTIMLEGFEKDLKMMELEKERKMRQLAEEETLRNEKMLETFKFQEELARKEDEKHLKTILNNEKQTMIEKSREIIERMREANRKHEEEIEDHRRKLREISNVQKRAEFEQKVFEIKKDNDLRLLEEEKKLQKMLLTLEEDQRLSGELREAIEYKEQECRERDLFYQSLKESQEAMLRNEKVKFEEYRNNYKKEMEKMRKTNESMNTGKLEEYREKNNSSDYKPSYNPKESLYSYGDSNLNSEEKERKIMGKLKKDEIFIQEGGDNNNYGSSEKKMESSGEYNKYSYNDESGSDLNNSGKYNAKNHYNDNNNGRNGGGFNENKEGQFRKNNNEKYHYEEKNEIYRKDSKNKEKEQENGFDYRKNDSNEQNSYTFDQISTHKKSRNDEESKNFEESIEKNEENKEDLMYSPDTEEKKGEESDRRFKKNYRMEMEELAEENEPNEDSPEERERRRVDLDLDQPKYRSHSNSPDRCEALDESEGLEG